jgi:chloride channel 7
MNLSDNNSGGPPDDKTNTSDITESHRINPSETLTLKTPLTEDITDTSNIDKLEFSADDSKDNSVKVVKTGPIAMAGVGKTLIFPRKDTIFKKKESLPFDEIQSLVWIDRPFQKRKEQCLTWIAHLLVGFSVGTVAFLMTILEETINENVIEHTQTLISDDNTTWFTAWIFYSGIAAMFAMTAGLLTTYYGPGASGSGVAELIGYMNGINYPDFVGINTLITKAVGVTFAVTGKLCVGKEGPLAHIGAIVGLSVLYIPGF